ncbi:MAG TPA: cation diffusion facilitator family transporter [Thermomicrobiales bacterium]|jgi:cation diffusion facilitator family transporter
MPEQFAAATTHPDLAAQAQRAKGRAALSSVAAAILLTSLKLAVGILTGSLGILAEALHSALDLVAAAITYVAVRLSGQPADREHRYGHGRVENLSAFVESGLLLITAAWVIYEAVRRLFFEEIHVEASIWAFAVMIISIVVDIGRSRNLSRVAKEHNSQALAADALHFRTDIWSSSVVLVGLAAIWLGDRFGFTLGGWLPKADAIAALGVAAIVLIVTFRLIRETTDDLLDRAPGETAALVTTAVEQVPGVIDCRRVRLRRAGTIVFADVVIDVARVATFAEAHAVSEAVEAAIHDILGAGEADVVVHMDPVAAPDETPDDAVRTFARLHGMRAHAVRLRAIDQRLDADLHVEVKPSLTLTEAHRLTTELERSIRVTDPRIGRLNTHLEAPEGTIERQTDVTTQRAELVARVRDIADGIAGRGACHEVKIYQPIANPERIELVLHCSFPGGLTVGQVHSRSAQIEHLLHDEFPNLGAVLLHAEPAEEDQEPTRAAASPARPVAARGPGDLE